jgi:hypothetical protein
MTSRITSEMANEITSRITSEMASGDAARRHDGTA